MVIGKNHEFLYIKASYALYYINFLVVFVNKTRTSHEMEPWFHSQYRGRVETLDAKQIARLC